MDEWLQTREKRQIQSRDRPVFLELYIVCDHALVSHVYQRSSFDYHTSLYLFSDVGMSWELDQLVVSEEKQFNFTNEIIGLMLEALDQLDYGMKCRMCDYQSYLTSLGIEVTHNQL